MVLFRCEECGCVDNTALGGTHSIRCLELFDDLLSLCVECAPKFYKDGTPNERAGDWHNKFPKRSAEGMYVDTCGHIWDEPESPFGKIVYLIGKEGLIPYDGGKT